MMKMLVISRYCAYDSAPYAGSKTHNFYLKRLIKDFDVKLVTIAAPSDGPKLDFKKYGIDADVIFVDEDPNRAFFFLLFNWRAIPTYFGKTLGLVNGYVRYVLLKKLKALRRASGYCPDCILLEWTQTVILVKDIKKIFPHAVYVAGEHDVSFLRFERQLAAAKGFARIKERLRCAAATKAEITALRSVNLIVPHNKMNTDALASRGIPISSIHPIAPYFTDYGEVQYNPSSTTILFFGAMDRVENYSSVAWFIEQVFLPRLAARYSLCIVGSRPHGNLNKYKSDRIEVTGFVEDIRPYLEKSLCKVAPLLSGAGIKVKVIEARSAGLPVLANAVAVEGIPAIDGKHYLHGETAREFAGLFDRIRENRVDLRAISENAKKLIADTFNLEKSYAGYKQAIVEACKSSI